MFVEKSLSPQTLLKHRSQVNEHYFCYPHVKLIVVAVDGILYVVDAHPKVGLNSKLEEPEAGDLSGTYFVIVSVIDYILKLPTGMNCLRIRFPRSSGPTSQTWCC